MSTYTTGSKTFPVGNVTIGGAGSSYISNSGAGTSYTLNTGAGVGGSSGSYMVSTGAITGTTTTNSTVNWAQPNNTFNNGKGETLMTIPAGGKEIILEKAATLQVDGNIVINGIDLEERLKIIENVLQIPTRDVTMESKHPKLAELYKQYMHELEKYKTWDRIKGEQDGTT